MDDMLDQPVLSLRPDQIVLLRKTQLPQLPEQLAQAHAKLLAAFASGERSGHNGRVLLTAGRLEDVRLAAQHRVVELSVYEADFALISVICDLRDELSAPWVDLVSIGTHLLAVDVSGDPLWQRRAGGQAWAPGRATSSAAGYLERADKDADPVEMDDALGLSWQEQALTELQEELGLEPDVLIGLRSCGMHLQTESDGSVRGMNVLATAQLTVSFTDLLPLLNVQESEVGQVWLGDRQLRPQPGDPVPGSLRQAAAGSPPLRAIVRTLGMDKAVHV